MAAPLGEKLLAEIRQERLDEVLHELRGLSGVNPDAPRHGPTGISEIDRLLDVFMPTPTPAPQPPPQVSLEEPQEEDLPTESSNDASNIPDQPAAVIRKDPVVEISSMTSAAGKSQLLYYLAATAILPSQFDGCPVGGRESAVVFIDTDGRFDAERLRTIAREIVRTATQEFPGDISAERDRESPGYLEGAIETMLVDSLRHVHVFRPESSASLLATLRTLDTYLLDLSRHYSSTRPLHVILIDSATAYFWEDKLHDEVARVEEIGRSHAEIENDRRGRLAFHMSDMYADLVAELKRLQRRFSCAVVYTTTTWSGRSVLPGRNLGGPDAYPLHHGPALPKTPACRPSLPAPWGTYPTVRLVVRRDAVRPFSSNMTVAEARGDASQRHDMVLRGRCIGCVNSWGCDDWPRSVLERLERVNWGNFAFHIQKDGVFLG